MTGVDEVVVVGGGTAGWLSACRIAAARPTARVTLIEAPGVATVGVGEGTWPTMRRTMAAIGIGEAELLAACDGAFKQGSRFIGWRDGTAGDAYLHPFTAPGADDPREIGDTAATFAECASPQAAICARDLAPRTRAMPDYAGALNYAYHLDAAQLAALLTAHGTRRLGVRHVAAHVEGVDMDADGRIAAVRLRGGASVAGDLFLDCTGQAALLIGGALGVPFVSRADVLPNDRALALQVPVMPGSPIASQTDATAHAAGWIWDIGLPGRRGIGCVYASADMDDDAAASILADYVRDRVPGAPTTLVPRQLAFRPGHRARFWVGNCLAVGLSAGFLEPLEASAIVMIELSLDALLADWPAEAATMPIHAARFDATFRYRWDRIVEFLKLHYLLSRRDEPYWRAHRAPEGVPERLRDLLSLWRHRPPLALDFPGVDEVFPAASYQYVLYGMGWPRHAGRAAVRDDRTRSLLAALPTNRAYLDALRAQPAPGENRIPCAMPS